MKYISLFSGIECASAAWTALGWEPLCFAEIEPFPSAVLAYRFPGVPNAGDMLNHDWSAYRGRCDVVVGGSPCFAAGTLVLTNEGLLPIEEVRPGHEVLTHRHRYRKVLNIGGKTAPVGWMTGQGNSGTVVTADHPYWAMPMRREYLNKQVGAKRVFSAPEWIMARSMPGSFWAMPSVFPESTIPPIEHIGNELNDIEINEWFFWLLGAYLGDGWAKVQGNRRGFFTICDGKHRGHRIAIIAKRCGLHCSVTEERTTNRFQISSKALARWVLQHFGHGAANKTLPAWVYGLPPVFRRSLFAGYQWADGHEEGNTIKTTSIGRKLSLSMRLLGASLGLHVSTRLNVPKRRECRIEGRVVNERVSQINSYNMASHTAFFQDGNLWMKAKRFEPLNIEIPVFNLEVEEDNSYTADGLFVHNCQAFSVAGHRRSLDDLRGNLTLAYVEACNAIDPAFCVWENVPGVYSTKDNAFGCFLAGMVGSSEPLRSDDPRGRWPGAGVVVGPKRALAWNTLDAQRFGVPQRRRRVFCVAVTLSHPAFAAGRTPNPAAILFEPSSLRGHSPPGRETGQSAVAYSGSRAAGRGGVDPDTGCGGGFQSVMEGVPDVSGTLGGGSGHRGFVNSLDICGAFIPVADRHVDGEVVPAVTAKWAKGSGGPAGDEAQNLIAVEIGPGGGKSIEVVPTLDTRAKDGPIRNQVGAAVVCIPLLEIGKRTGTAGERHNAGIGIGGDGDPMYTLQASARHGVVCAEAADNREEEIAVAGSVAHTLRAEGADASEDGTGRGTPVVAVHQNQSGELRTGPIANTLNTNGNATGRNSPLVAAGFNVRRLTPRECERLQGLPDDWTLIPYGRGGRVADPDVMAAYWDVPLESARTLASDSLRYKAIGNGMAVPCLWWIGKRLEWVLQRLAEWDGYWNDDCDWGGLFNFPGHASLKGKA